MKGSKDSFHEKSPIHNEITAIPLLDIDGNIITIDAMGIQTQIAEKIIENGAYYILSLKGNQKELLEQVESRFKNQRPETVDQQIEKDHGRIETRRCEMITNLEYVDNRADWKNM